MPYSLKQLEERRDSCIKKIQELKASAEDKGAEEIGNLNFNAVGFFHGLFNMRSEEMDSFLSFFPEILECARKAVNEEKKEEVLKSKLKT